MQSEVSYQECIEDSAVKAIHVKVKAKLPEDVRGICEVVGKWLWIEFPSNANVPRKTEKLLKKAGFFFNTRRGLWQNPCGVSSMKSRRNPKYTYHVKPLDRDANKGKLFSYSVPAMTGATEDTPF